MRPDPARRPILLVPALRAGLCLSLVAGLAGCPEKPKPPEPPPPRVTVAQPEERELVESDEYNGYLAPVETVDVRARVRGHIAKIHFIDGQLVKKGDVLFELDPRPFQAEVDQAKETLKIFDAQREAASKEELRLKELLGKGGASKSQVDKAVADTKSFDAQILAQGEDIKRKELDLEYSRITAPIGGRIGRALLTEGNLVNAGGSDPILTTIVSLDPIKVYFFIDERALQNYLKRRPPPAATGSATPVRDRKITFRFGLETDDGYPYEGLIDFAQNRVDSNTGTIEIRGEARNEKLFLIPGSRVRVRLPVSDPFKATLVPDTAILTDQDRKYVLAIGEKNVVLRRDVKLGRLQDDGTRILLPSAKEGEGVKASDWIIVLGLQQARVNYPVEPLDAAGKPVVRP